MLNKIAVWIAIVILATAIAVSHTRKREALRLLCKWNLLHMGQIDKVYAWMEGETTAGRSVNDAGYMD